MSQLFKKRVTLLKDVVASQLHKSLFYCGMRLSPSQDSTARACYAQWLTFVDQLLPDSDPDRIVTLYRWYNCINDMDLYDLALVLKSSISFLRCIDEKDKDDYDRFKHDLQDYGVSFGWFLEPVEERIVELCGSANPIWFADVNQYFSYPGRLNLSLDFSEEMTVDYLSNEERLARLDFYQIRYLGVINSIMREWLSSFEIDDFIPKHGSGGIAGSKTKSMAYKYRDLHSDVRIRYLHAQLGLTCSQHLIDDDNKLDRTGEIVIVPKSMTTGRMICKEPATLMYLQQGVWHSLDRYLSRHHILRQHISIHDQGLNREYCRRASVDPAHYATIDLSSASDSVSWKLVKRVFARTPLLKYLLLTKSDRARLPNGQVVQLEKFAPMGSALCFPIESLIFASFCEYVVRYSGIRFKDNPYCVYGDDIIVDTRLLEHLLDVLDDCGFLVNTSKSYMSPDNTFRESCGVEYYHGQDVSPIRISRNFADDDLIRHPNLFSEYISLANIADEHNRVMLRYWFIQKLLKLPRPLRPCFSLQEGGVHSGSSTNVHLHQVTKFRDPYVRCGMVHSAKESPRRDEDESIRLYEWLRSTAERTRPVLWPGECIVSEIGGSTPKLRSRLVSKP